MCGVCVQNSRLLEFSSSRGPRVKGISKLLQCRVLSFRGRRTLYRPSQGISAQVSDCQYNLRAHSYWLSSVRVRDHWENVES